jgi:hypothetical protein
MGNHDDQSGRVAGDRANSNPELDSVRCEALRRNLASRLLLCCWDELRVIDIDLGRLEKGRHEHGYLDLSIPRDWKREEAEERVDARIYRMFDDIVETDAQVAKIEAAADIDARFIDDGDLDEPRSR